MNKKQRKNKAQTVPVLSPYQLNEIDPPFIKKLPPYYFNKLDIDKVVEAEDISHLYKDEVEARNCGQNCQKVMKHYPGSAFKQCFLIFEKGRKYFLTTHYVIEYQGRYLDPTPFEYDIPLTRYIANGIKDTEIGMMVYWKDYGFFDVYECETFNHLGRAVLNQGEING